MPLVIRNYVKKGLIANPVKKQYYADHIAHLIAISILKHVVSLENIQELFRLQRLIYTAEVAYNYFCTALENILFYQYGLSDRIQDVGNSYSTVKQMLRSAIIAVSHIIYLHGCFSILSESPKE